MHDYSSITEEQLDQLRLHLNQIYDVCDELDAQGTEASFAGRSVSIRKLFEVETTIYLLYITASDRQIDETEIELVNKIMGRDYSMDDCMKALKAAGQMGEKRPVTTPVSFRLLVDHTKAQGRDISETLITFYDVLGLVLSQADGARKLEEDEARKYCLDIMKTYALLEN